MLQAKNFDTASACALYNKGVNTSVVTLDSLTHQDEKKMANYLVVSNNCILSLSLFSLSLVEQAYITYFFFSRTRARGVA
ncbi:hypothetical protein HMPREF0973_01281 [Prevotella veroralis F0319]|uniref:Uncharacterized protein n=2 Tax=Prevotella veroralis TaxID=28137 RepID=C9MNU3_9BACT|nr:hypothetical protein HMPREF0973_01281 [Prevotella veroralis F0319]